VLISDYANVYSHEHDLNDDDLTNTRTEIGPKTRITYHAKGMSGVRVYGHGRSDPWAWHQDIPPNPSPWASGQAGQVKSIVAATPENI